MFGLGAVEAVVVIPLLMAGVVLYFLPAIIAKTRGHRDRGPISLLDTREGLRTPPVRCHPRLSSRREAFLTPPTPAP